MSADPLDVLAGALSGWPPVQPIRGTHALPVFPLDALPDDARLFTEAVAESTQTPVDLAAGMVLAATSTAALGATRVLVRDGWTEELALYVLAVLRSGERKSAVLDEIAGPLRDVERDRQEDARPAVREARARRDVLESERAKLVRGKDADWQEVARIDAELEELGAVRLPRLLADDTTPEQLAHLLAAHGRLGIVSAESAFLDNVRGRYSDGQANLHLACQAYSGESTTVDRRSGDSLHLDRPLLAVGVCVQPHVLAALREDPTARSQGLVARFAYLVPRSMVGGRALDTPLVPGVLRAWWAATVARLVALPREGSVGSVALSQGVGMRFSPGALERFREFQHAHEPRLNPGTGDLAGIADWAGRHPGRVARLAGLLHLLDDGDPDGEIGEEPMRGALRIGDHLVAHAAHALDTDRTDVLERVAAFLARHASPGVSRRELHRGPFGGHGPVEDVEQAAGRLVDLGYLAPIPPDPSSGAGRPPSPAWTINPAVRSA